MGRRNANSHPRRGNAKIASGGKGHGEGGVTEADVQRHAAGRSLHYVPPLTSLCPATTALVANLQDAEATANQYNQRQSAIHRCVRCPLRPLTGSVWIHLTGSVWIVGWFHLSVCSCCLSVSAALINHSAHSLPGTLSDCHTL